MVPNRAKHQICCLFFLKRSSIQYLRFLLFSLVIFVTKESVVFLRVHLAKERYLLQMIGLMMETCHWTQSIYTDCLYFYLSGTINPFLPNVPFCPPPENIRKPLVFPCFLEDQIRLLEINISGFLKKRSSLNDKKYICKQVSKPYF